MLQKRLWEATESEQGFEIGGPWVIVQLVQRQGMEPVVVVSPL